MTEEDLAAKIRLVAHRAVTEGVNLAYVEEMRGALYQAADLIETALQLRQSAEEREDRYGVEEEVSRLREQLDQAYMVLGRLISAEPGDETMDVVHTMREAMAEAGIFKAKGEHHGHR